LKRAACSTNLKKEVNVLYNNIRKGVDFMKARKE